MKINHPSYRLGPHPLDEIVQWMLQQHQHQSSAHNWPNDSPDSATESLRGRWRNDAATLECLRKHTTLDLSACEICTILGRGYTKGWISDNLSILLDCMPQLTALDLRNSLQGNEQWYRDEICDAGLLEAIGKLTSLQVLRLGAVLRARASSKGPRH